MSRSVAVIGHGLSGTVMALTLLRYNIPFVLYGASIPGESSVASSGLIAPLTGRRYVKAWHIEEYLASALDFYRWTENLFSQSFYHEIDIVRFLVNDEAQKAWAKRSGDPGYAAFISNQKIPNLDVFQKPYGLLTGGYQLLTKWWLDAAHQYLKESGLLVLRDRPFSTEEMTEDQIIVATGAVDPRYNHGVIPNKGEALIVRMRDWNIPLVIKDEVFIVPWADDQYWIGSYYERWPKTPGPSEVGRSQLLNGLSRIYPGPVEVIAHLAGIRPTVDDRRPLIGIYPGKEHVFQFNGMGTKATSLAPFWAPRLLSLMRDGLSLPEEISPARY